MNVQQQTSKVHYLNMNQVKRAIALLYRAKVPVCIIGGVGCGKTTVVEEFAAEMNKATEGKFGFWPLTLAVMEREDVIGIPRNDDKPVLSYKTPGCMPFNTKAHGVLLADEFDRAEVPTQNAFLRFLQGKDVNGNVLSENAYLALTMNGTSDVYTTALSKAAATRVCMIYASSRATGSLDAYDKWAADHGISPLMRGFARFRPDLVEVHEDFEELAHPTPRSRDLADRILAAADAVKFETGDILPACIAGVIGRAAAAELMQYREIFRKCPTPDEVLRDPDAAKIPDENSLKHAIGLSVIRHVGADLEKADAAVRYIMRLGADRIDITRALMSELGTACPRVITNKKYQQWGNANRDDLVAAAR